MGSTLPTRTRNRPLHSEPPPVLLQFVLLSMLLHALVVLLFGTSVNGGIRRGDSLLGSLDVTLRQLSPERGSGFTLAPGAETDRPGTALLRPLEGAAPPPTPTSAVPDVRPRDAPSVPSPVTPAMPAPIDVAPPVPDAKIAPPPVVEPLPSLNLNAPVEVDKPVVVAPTVVAPKPEPSIVPPVVAPPREALAPKAVPLEQLAPPKIEQQDVVPPVELRPRAAPVAVPTAVPLERIPPVKIEREIAPPVELPAPRKAPVETSAPPARAVPAPEREATPAAVPPQALPLTQPENAAGRERTAPSPTPGKPAAAAAPARSDAGAELPRLRYGAPNVDEEIFGTKRDAASPPPTDVAPGLTAEALRRRVREIANEGSGSRGVLNLVPPPPPVEKKDTLAEGIAKAAKPDCRTAYAGMGLLAVAPLVGSTIGNGGCRW
jgi:hypothetical protein